MTEKKTCKDCRFCGFCIMSEPDGNWAACKDFDPIMRDTDDAESKNEEEE